MDFDFAIKSEVLKEQIEMLKSYIENLGLPYLIEYTKQWRIFDMLLRKTTKNDSIDREDSENLYEELSEMIKDIELTNDEKAYLAYNRYKRHFNESDKDAEWDIILRRKLIEIVGDGSIEKALETLQRDHFEYPSDIQFAIELINMTNWEGIDELKQEVQKNVEFFFNRGMNCGGYALRVNTCIFGGAYKKRDAMECLDRNVTSLLEKFPFIRLLGDTDLGDDEYIVIYRTNSDGGHHFVRIDSDGIIRDKNECYSPRVIEDLTDEKKVWGRYLKDCPSAIFAVNVNHDIHSERYSYVLGDGLSFEKVTLENMGLGNSSYDYHNHNYTIADDEEGNRYVYSNGERVATIMSDESGTIVVEEEEKREYISNTRSSTFEKYLEQLRTKDNNTEENKEIDWDFEL